MSSTSRSVPGAAGQPPTSADYDLDRLWRRRWTPAIVAAIAAGTVRYTHIRDACHGINPGTLTATLRELERLGIVRRTWFDESPPRVEYTLTSSGKRRAATAATLAVHGTAPATRTEP